MSRFALAQTAARLGSPRCVALAPNDLNRNPIEAGGDPGEVGIGRDAESNDEAVNTRRNTDASVPRLVLDLELEFLLRPPNFLRTTHAYAISTLSASRTGGRKWPRVRSLPCASGPPAKSSAYGLRVASS